MKIEIRQIRESDTQGFYNVLCSVANEGIYILTTTPPCYEKMANFVRNNIDNNHAQFVAVIDNQIIGWADIIPLERNTMTHVGQLGMGIIAAFRGLGIGASLLDKTISHAWDQQLTRIELEVFTDNESAIALYNKFQFQTEGVKKNARYFENVYQDIAIMAQYRLPK